MPESIQNKGCAPLSLETIDSNGLDAPLRALNNELSYLAQNYNLNETNFGGSPSDRKYPWGYTKEISDPSITFHGCPVVHNNEMLIFGAGPNMKQYLHNMYRDYDDYGEENSAGKRDCERKLGKTIEEYFRKNTPQFGHSIVNADTEYNRIFNYLLNYKNCEAEDLEYTNLYKATVKGANEGVQIEGMHKEFNETDFASQMRNTVDAKTPKQIGYYKDKHPSSYDFKKIYNSWEEINDKCNTEDKCKDADSQSYPIFRWSYNFDYEEPVFDDHSLGGDKLDFTTFDQNPIFNELNKNEDGIFKLPSNYKFKKRCWLPDKYLNDFAFDDALNKYGIGDDITRKMGDDSDTELNDEVLCPPVHPRFDPDWNFRFMKGKDPQTRPFS